MQLERAQASLSEQIGQAKSAAELDNLTGRYLASGEATGSAGALLAQVATRKETISQAERNRQIFGAQVPAQATTAANSRPAVQTHRCDQLAADPDDPTRVTAGVADEAIKSAQAIAACTEALKTHANEPRFAFQLGRALLAGGKETAAVQSFAAAAQAGHAGAMVYFGMAMAEGAGGLPKEPEKGEQMQALGERAGYRSGQPIAAPTPDQTNVAAAKGSTAAGSVPGKYNMPHIVQAIYLGDASKLDKDAKTNASYLLSQARMLAGDPTCRAFLQKDVDAWSVKQARGLVKAVRPEDMLNNWLRGMEAVVKNPTEAAINIGASEQHYASLENYAASDMMEFVQQVGPCNSPKFNRYVANLKSYLDSGTTAGK